MIRCRCACCGYERDPLRFDSGTELLVMSPVVVYRRVGMSRCASPSGRYHTRDSERRHHSPRTCTPFPHHLTPLPLHTHHSSHSAPISTPSATQLLAPRPSSAGSSTLIVESRVRMLCGFISMCSQRLGSRTSAAFLYNACNGVFVKRFLGQRQSEGRRPWPGKC